MRRALLALAVVHPAPSAINAALVATLAIVAGAGQWVAGLLAAAMLGFQFSIGALNDIVDIEADRLGKPWKPIPAGKASIPIAVAVVIVGAAIGVVISTSLGMTVLVLGTLGYASGVAYDLWMRRLGLGWLCLAAAFPLMLAWTWVAAAGTLPPRWPFVLPLAALAGVAIHLANSLVDVDSDERFGRPSLATQLGPRRARRTLASLVLVVLVLAWATLAFGATLSGGAVAVSLIATIATVLGVALSWQEASSAREAGWLLQAVGLATVAVVWLASIAGAW